MPGRKTPVRASQTDRPESIFKARSFPNLLPRKHVPFHPIATMPVTRKGSGVMIRLMLTLSSRNPSSVRKV